MTHFISVFYIRDFDHLDTIFFHFVPATQECTSCILLHLTTGNFTGLHFTALTGGILKFPGGLLLPLSAYTGWEAPFCSAWGGGVPRWVPAVHCLHFLGTWDAFSGCGAMPTILSFPHSHTRWDGSGLYMRAIPACHLPLYLPPPPRRSTVGRSLTGCRLPACLPAATAGMMPFCHTACRYRYRLDYGAVHRYRDSGFPAISTGTGGMRSFSAAGLPACTTRCH